VGSPATCGSGSPSPRGVAVGTAGQLRLAVTSKRNAVLSGDTGNIALTVGAAPPPPQDKIVLAVSSVFTPGSKSPTDGALVIPVGNTNIRVDFTALIKDAGTYNIGDPTIASNPNNAWIALLASSRSITTTANSNNQITIGIRSQAGAPATNLTLRVTSAADANVFGEISVPIRTTP